VGLFGRKDAASGPGPFRYECPDCGLVKEFKKRPAADPTCCGWPMRPLP
jgi:hypothetical protein